MPSSKASTHARVTCSTTSLSCLRVRPVSWLCYRVGFTAGVKSVDPGLSFKHWNKKKKPAAPGFSAAQCMQDAAWGLLDTSKSCSRTVSWLLFRGFRVTQRDVSSIQKSCLSSLNTKERSIGVSFITSLSRGYTGAVPSHNSQHCRLILK